MCHFNVNKDEIIIVDFESFAEFRKDVLTKIGNYNKQEFIVISCDTWFVEQG
jgi:hypothetical protein